jgi:hypothetical protein
MVVGQPIFVEGPAHFIVSSIPSTTQVVLEFKGYEDDVAPTTVIAVNAGVSPGGTQANTTNVRIAAYATGTAYDLTLVSTLLNFGTIDPKVTLPEAGTWMIFARARIDYFNATYAAAAYKEVAPTFTLELQETANGGGQLASSPTTFAMRDVIDAYFSAQTANLPAVVHIAAAVGDVIELWGKVSAFPTATSGTDEAIQAVEAEVVALKISEATS